MGVAIVKTPTPERIELKKENSRWSAGLRLPEGFHRIDSFLADAPEDAHGRLGSQVPGEHIVWGEPMTIPKLEDRVRIKLPNAPLGQTFFIDRKAGSNVGPDILLARQSLDPGKLPELRTWASFHGNNKAVCNYAKRGRHFTTIAVNGHPATGQPKAVYAFRDVAYELLTEYDITIWAVSSQRTCDYQCTVCKNICGNCGGCPGRCGEPGGSTHQPGLAFDFFIKAHPGRTYPEAYEKCRQAFMHHDFDNFTDWNPSGTDPNHASYRCKA